MKILVVCAAAAALSACALEDERAQVDVQMQSVAGDAPAQDVAREAVLLYEELAARLEERGVTLEEMEGAVDAGDAERVRELFGYSPAEFATMNARAIAVAMRASDPGLAAGSVEGLECDGNFLGTFECALMWASIMVNFPTAAVGIVIVGSVYCGWKHCRWKEDRPRRKQP